MRKKKKLITSTFMGNEKKITKIFYSFFIW